MACSVVVVSERWPVGRGGMGLWVRESDDAGGEVRECGEGVAGGSGSGGGGGKMRVRPVNGGLRELTKEKQEKEVRKCRCKVVVVVMSFYPVIAGGVVVLAVVGWVPGDLGWGEGNMTVRQVVT
ncbi:hypothetical protein E2C01_031610 [Portunus trituberculatus]|uniref:Uncharacterized protein n=1 Tax=Portunus trituberculatus TaxID=210409 RepID=A0A5B7EYK6_PORTR|nr:hypothetical protein [Portunus trituberculatus]